MTAPIMTVPAAVPSVRSRPVPWRNLAWVALRQRRGLFVGLGVLLGLIAAYLVVMAIIQVAATGAFTAIFYWYFRPFLALGQVSEMLPLSFALLGVAFAAWTLLAYALAAFLGAVFRRTVLAMVLTLVLYVVLAMATVTAIRPHYATPVTVSSASVGSTGASDGSGWVISDLERAPSGQELSRNDLYPYFQQLPSSVQNSTDSGAFTTWLVALSAVLIGATVWLVRRRGA